MGRGTGRIDRQAIYLTLLFSVLAVTTEQESMVLTVMQKNQPIENTHARTHAHAYTHTHTQKESNSVQVT